MLCLTIAVCQEHAQKFKFYGFWRGAVPCPHCSPGARGDYYPRNSPRVRGAHSPHWSPGARVLCPQRLLLDWEIHPQLQYRHTAYFRDHLSHAKGSSNNRRIITPYHVSRIFVEDKYRILYCEVPKAGCSNWKRVLMVLNGLASSTKDIQHNTVHYGNYLKRLDGFDRKGIYHRLNTYTKMLFIREPFEKLVSAFRDKFEHPNNYYHPVFGKAIISRYRVNASKEEIWRSH
uniref:Carbohydrate sulfotransferase n=1 Tax=Chelonoidis abingdonii TaxID=106734 RepID=A0A8C0GEP7_CHEAB